MSTNVPLPELANLRHQVFEQGKELEGSSIKYDWSVEDEGITELEVQLEGFP